MGKTGGNGGNADLVCKNMILLEYFLPRSHGGHAFCLQNQDAQVQYSASIHKTKLNRFLQIIGQYHWGRQWKGVCISTFSTALGKIVFSTLLVWIHPKRSNCFPVIAHVSHTIRSNRNCLCQFREIPWNQTTDVHRGSILITRVITCNVTLMSRKQC